MTEVRFELIPLSEAPERHWTEEHPRAATNPYQAKCPCGRFAKRLSGRQVERGFLLKTECSRCGAREQLL